MSVLDAALWLSFLAKAYPEFLEASWSAWGVFTKALFGLPIAIGTTAHRSLSIRQMDESRPSPIRRRTGGEEGANPDRQLVRKTSA